MKTLRILFFILLLTAPGVLKAQFSISNTTTGSIGRPELRDSTILRLPDIHQNEFFSKEFWKAERRKKRKERNTVELTTKLQFSQTSFKNWTSNGDNTLTEITTIFFKYRYTRKKYYAEYIFDGKYGLNYIEKKKFKNVDNFKTSLQLDWTINKHWSYAANGTLESQFTTSYRNREDNTRTSTLMAPGTLALQVGFKYNNSPFSALISPVGGNATFVLDEQFREKGMKGVDPGKKAKWEVGPSVKLNLDYKFHRDIFHIKSEVYSFTNTKKTPLVRWTVDIDIKATKLITTTIQGKMTYDKESNAEKSHKPSYYSLLQVGLAYTLKNK